LKKRSVQVTKTIPSLPAIPEDMTHGNNDNNGDSNGGQGIDPGEATSEVAETRHDITSDNNAGSDPNDGKSHVNDTCTFFNFYVPLSA